MRLKKSLKIAAWKIASFVSNSCMPLFVQFTRWFPFLRKPVVKTFYDAVAREFNADGDSFKLMNYGYASPNSSDFPIRLDKQDEKEFKFSWRLVYETVKAGRLAGKKVLVVGCGGGGDAYFVKRYMQAKTVIGIDLSPRAIAICQRNGKIDGLSFQVGDAERLTFENERFDAVVNIESSHHYPSLRKFYEEVRRVLRPGGVFLYADFFWDKRHYRDDLLKTGFQILEEEDILENIVLAAEQGYELRREQIAKWAPAHFFNEMLEWSGTEGTHMYRVLKKKAVDYKRFVLVRD